MINENDNMNFQLDKKVTVGTLVNALIMLAVVISGFVYIQSDVAKVKDQQEVQDRFRADVRQNYINREQLEYMVIQRLDRMEGNIEARLERIEQAVKEQ